MHFLGALRSAAQYFHMSLYCFAYVVVVMESVVVIWRGTIIESQRGLLWHVKFLFLHACFFYIFSFSFSRANRVPFDLPEAESGGVGIRLSCRIRSLGFAYFLLKNIQIWFWCIPYCVFIFWWVKQFIFVKKWIVLFF